MRRSPAFLALSLALPALSLGALPGLAEAQGRNRAPKLSHAIALYDQGQDERARRELQLLAGKSLPSGDAARVHIYLGLLKLNALDTDAARAEFEKAISIDPTVELPVDASPKAGLVFKQARTEADQAAAPPAPAPVAPTPAPEPPSPAPAPVQAPLVVVEQPAAPEPAPGRSHVVSFIVGGVGLATALTGGVFLGLSATSLSSARSAADVGVSQSDVKQSANQQYLAEWLLSAGGGVVGAAAVVFVIESLTGGGKPTAEVASHAMSAALEGFRF